MVKMVKKVGGAVTGNLGKMQAGEQTSPGETVGKAEARSK